MFIDGLNKGWENGVHSDFVSSDDTKFAVSRLNWEFGREEVNQTRNFYLSSIDWSKYTVNGKRVVKKNTFELFQKCLIHHFDIRFRQKTIVWPKRNNGKQTIV